MDQKSGLWNRSLAISVPTSYVEHLALGFPLAILVAFNMPSLTPSYAFLLPTIALLALFVAPTVAFGAGNIGEPISDRPIESPALMPTSSFYRSHRRYQLASWRHWRHPSQHLHVPRCGRQKVRKTRCEASVLRQLVTRLLSSCRCRHGQIRQRRSHSHYLMGPWFHELRLRYQGVWSYHGPFGLLQVCPSLHFLKRLLLTVQARRTYR